jgi:hypothetical protein
MERARFTSTVSAVVRLFVVSLVVASCRDAAAPKALAPIAPTTDEVDGEIGIQSNQWLTLPSLSSIRAGHAAVKFNSCIWSIGGDSAYGIRASRGVEQYCPSTDPSRWTAGPPLPEARTSFAGVGVIGKKIYVAGGLDGTGHSRSTMYVYDATRGWSLEPEPLPALACGGGGGAVVNGKLYVYALAAVVDSNNPDPIGCHPDSWIFAVYDPAKAAPPRWRLLPLPSGGPWNGDRCDHSVTSVGAIVYLVGGSSLCDRFQMVGVEAFNTTTGQWLPFTPGRASPPHQGGDRQTAIGLNGRLFLLGGYNGHQIWWPPYTEVHVYDAVTDSWDQLRSMQYPYRLYAAAAALGTRITLVGGETSSVEQLNVPAGCDVHEPDGTVAKASPWELRTFMDNTFRFPYLMSQAHICAAGDVDYFAPLPLDNDGETSFHVEMTPPAGKDYQLELLTLNGKTVVAKSARVGSLKETVLYPNNGGPGYLIRVKSQGGSFDKMHPYRLEVVP